MLRGLPDAKISILVNRTKLHLTQSLHNALKQLRVMKITKLWINALCINQEDHERSRQVGLMKLIYSMAKEVIAWIGPTSTDSSQAMTALRRISLVTGTNSKHSRESHSKTTSIEEEPRDQSQHGLCRTRNAIQHSRSHFENLMLDEIVLSTRT
jgi:hypothetical protein